MVVPLSDPQSVGDESLHSALHRRVSAAVSLQARSEDDSFESEDFRVFAPLYRAVSGRANGQGGDLGVSGGGGRRR